MKLLVVNNLASGFRDGAIYDYLRSVCRDGDEVCMRCTDGTTDISSMLDDAGLYDRHAGNSRVQWLYAWHCLEFTWPYALFLHGGSWR